MTRDKLISKLNNICGEGIISYKYSYHVAGFINRNGISCSRMLEEYVRNNVDAAVPVPWEERNLIFTVYYALCYYYKHYNKADMLKSMISLYDQYFSYAPLHDEVKSWYYRLTGSLVKAHDIDRQMMDEIDVTVNAVPYVSYASSVVKMLDREKGCRETYWDNDAEKYKEWQRAVQAIEDTMEQYAIMTGNMHYGKHYAIYGQLIALTPDLESLSLEQASSILSKAEHYIMLAIQNENERAEEYAIRCQQYYHIQNKISLQRMKLTSMKYQEEVDRHLAELDQAKKDFDRETEERKAQEIGILTLFATIISLIIGGLSVGTGMELVNAAVLFSIITAACVFMEAFCMSVYLRKPLRKVVVVICILSALIMSGLVILSAVMTVYGIA